MSLGTLQAAEPSRLRCVGAVGDDHFEGEEVASTRCVLEEENYDACIKGYLFYDLNSLRRGVRNLCI